MNYDIYLNPLSNVDFAPSDEYTEIYQNVRTLLVTTKYSVPLDRSLGINADFVDSPTSKAMAILSEEVIDVIGKYEPRATVDSISFEGDQDGKLIPKVRISVND